MRATVGVFGAGSWGTALAILLARNGHRVLLGGRDSAKLNAMAEARCNEHYLPGIAFPDLLSPQPDPGALAVATDRLLLAVPSHGFRAAAQRLAGARSAAGRAATRLIVACAGKGFEPATGKLLSDVAAEAFGSTTARAVVSGPGFAREIATALPTALTVAATDAACGEEVASWLRSDRVRVYLSKDLIGVQLGGAIKNVMAIAAGISDGLQLGASARAALITRGLAELTRLGTALGGEERTLMGLAGLGDLILTCTDDQSRNRRVGIGLGQGRSLRDVMADIGQEAEGVNTARELHRISRGLAVEMPITEQVFRVLFEGLSPQRAVDALLERDPKPE